MSWRRARKVIIHNVPVVGESGTTGGSSIEGILVGTSRGHYVLRAAAFLRDSEDSYDLDGEVRVPKSKVDFIQVID